MRNNRPGSAASVICLLTYKGATMLQQPTCHLQLTYKTRLPGDKAYMQKITTTVTTTTTTAAAAAAAEAAAAAAAAAAAEATTSTMMMMTTTTTTMINA